MGVPNRNEPIVEEAVRILEDAGIRQSRTHHMGRRLRLALYDLGLIGIVGEDWVTPGEEEFAFTALDHRTVQRLVARLVSLANGTPAPASGPGVGQMAFDFAPQLVIDAPATSGWHLDGEVA